MNLRAEVSVEETRELGVHVESQDLSLSGSFIDSSFIPKIGGMDARETLEPIYLAVKAISEMHGLKGRLRVRVKSEIPIAAGMGSSAAVAVATVAAVASFFKLEMSKEEISQLAFRAEEYVHGRPSGIDQTISTFGGVISYRRTRGFNPIEVSAPIPLVIGDTGLKRSTGKLVAMVRERREEFPGIMESIIRAGGNITVSAAEALRKGDLRSLGELMNLNHGLLSAIGVSNGVLDRLVNAARGAGALGSKLTGAGGGGCMIALADQSNIDEVARAIEAAGGRAIPVHESKEGVKACLL